MATKNECPRCRAGRMRTWTELDEEEREIVKRLPASAEHSIEERTARHRWCARCWYEDKGGDSRNV